MRIQAVSATDFDMSINPTLVMDRSDRVRYVILKESEQDITGPEGNIFVVNQLGAGLSLRSQQEVFTRY